MREAWGKFISNWILRHKTHWNRVLHALGIPMTVLAIVPLLCGRWLWAAALFICGYALQFIGHATEGSEVGELIWIKRLLGK